MNWWNPPVVVDSSELMTMTDHEILVAQYQFIVSATLVAFAFVLFFFIFKFLVWFLPKFWYKNVGFDK